MTFSQPRKGTIDTNHCIWNDNEFILSKVYEITNLENGKFIYSAKFSQNRHIAHRLKMGEVVKPETFQSVSILLTDIVDFSSITATSTPMQVRRKYWFTTKNWITWVDIMAPLEAWIKKCNVREQKEWINRFMGRKFIFGISYFILLNTRSARRFSNLLVWNTLRAFSIQECSLWLVLQHLRMARFYYVSDFPRHPHIVE